MAENNFVKWILLYNVRFSPSYLMVLLQLQNSILFKAPAKRMCTSRERKRREMKVIERSEKEDISVEERIVQKARMMTRNVEEEKILFIIFLCFSNSNIIETRQFR